jgi:AcrR family transcriptional regulator
LTRIIPNDRGQGPIFCVKISCPRFCEERKIARPRDFEIDDVVRKALLVFWLKGYEGASLSDIEGATGVARMSLYNVFGNKEGLFYAALERYIDATKKLYEKYLKKRDIESLEKLIDAYARSEKLGDVGSWGCLMLNTITANEGVSLEAHRMIEGFRIYAIKKIEAVLKSACQTGEIANASLDCRAWAEFILVTMWGAKAAIRHAGSIDAALPVADTLSQILRGLCGAPKSRTARKRMVRTGRTKS